jgi:pentatricopeptide repeat protein
MDRVPSLLNDMKAAVPPAEPDIVTYSTLVKGFCNSGALDRGLEILRDMQSDGKLQPDEMLFNSLLDGCAKEHRPADALELLENMKAVGVRPSNFTLSMIVKLMGRCRRLNQAFSIVEEIRAEYDLKVNIQVYTCLIQACFNNRQASKAVALYDKIIAEGLLPDEMTYSALVQGCLRGGLVDKALHLARCAHGLAEPKLTGGAPPGINARCLDELVHALPDAKGKTLLAEVGKCQTGRGGPKGKGSSKGGAGASNAPWRKGRD